MADLTVTHLKVSAIADNAAALASGKVCPSHWNANHTILIPAGTVTGLDANYLQGYEASAFLKIDQTTPQTTTGTFSFPSVIIGGGSAISGVAGLSINADDGAFGIKADTVGRSAYLDFRDSDEGTRALFGVDGAGFTGTADQFVIATWTNSPIKFFTNQIERGGFSADGVFSLTKQAVFSEATLSPFTVASNVMVLGLNSDLLDGNHASAFSLSSHGHAHSGLTNLTWSTAGHTIDTAVNMASYALQGNNTSGGNLTLQSTSHVTKGKILFGTSAYDEVNNYLGVGTVTPISLFNISNTETNNPFITVDHYSSIALSSNTIIGRGARGTATSPSAVQTNDVLAGIVARGYGSTGFSATGRGLLQWRAAENWTDSAQGTYASIWTTPTGSSTLTERMRIMANGDVGIGTSSSLSPLHISRTGSAGIALIERTDGKFMSLATGTNASTVNFDDSGYLSMNKQSSANKGTTTGLTEVLRIDTSGNITFIEGGNLILGTTTGTKVGTGTTQKLAFYNSTPIVQPLSTTDLGTVLSNLGLRASGTAYPVTTSGNTTLTGVNAIALPYANFSSSSTQTSGGTTSENLATLNTEAVKSRITHSTVTNSSRMTVDEAGTYFISFSAVANASAPNKHIDIWFKKDGTNIANSNTHYELPIPGENLITVTLIDTATANQYYEVAWASTDDSGMQLMATASASSPTRPASPSIIATIMKISN